MVLTKITNGSKWRYTKRDGEYFTFGAIYEVLCDEDDGGQFRIQDNTGNGRHHWTNDSDFHAHFERVDGPIRTRKEIVPGRYGIVSVASPTDTSVTIGLGPDLQRVDAIQLRAAASTLIELADALESETPV